MINPYNWNRIVASFPQTHVLQTWQWGVVKQRFGWKVLHKIWKDEKDILGASQVLKREVRFPLIGTMGTLLYVPKGPLVTKWEDLSLVERIVGDLEALAREHKAVMIKIDADIEIARGNGGVDWSECFKAKEQNVSRRDALLGEPNLGEKIVSLLRDRGWIYSREQIQFRNTMVLDLTSTEDELLRRMKQKTRYNIRLAERKGVKVREGTTDDLALLYRMYHETSRRDGFIVRDEEYYTMVWETFLKQRLFPDDGNSSSNHRENHLLSYEPFARALIAEYDGEPVAGMVLFIFRDKAWYMYGMSTDRHRDKMPNYLLHWRAIQVLRQLGVRDYDLWGAPDRFDVSDPMYGVYRFKAGFGAEIVQHIGAWDFPLSVVKYRLYQEVLPKYLKLLRLYRRNNL
ncbi:MAG: peptidoglycan bridge formation glycyltransferase FemA/FemB family protein [Anaerolineales bacterium]